jgi:pimeloyl-ACP methyl ester carboxylesterase
MGSEPLPNAFARGRVTQSVRVRAERAGGAEVPVTAVSDQDVVALHLANGPTLYLHPESARDLLRAQVAEQPHRGAQDADPNRVTVLPQLAWHRLEQAGATRGAARGLGDVLLSLVEVIREPAADLVAGAVVKRVDEQVNEGVYALAADGLARLKEREPIERIPDSGGKPVLVFIHGSFSTTKGTFDKLWVQHPQRVQQLFRHYENRVYALEHRTLGQSPIGNALTLAKALPKNTPVHLVTHSRGGLVAEVLARASAPGVVTPEELERHFSEHEAERLQLADLAQRLTPGQVKRVVRVACPARGTMLASKRLDAYLSVFKWALQLAGLPVVPEILDFLAAVAQRRADWDALPGLAAQIPDSALVQWLHAPTRDRIPGELRVVAGDIAGDSVVSWLKTLASDSFYRTDNDLVVQTSSMYGGSPRRDGAGFVFDQGGKVSHFAYFANELTAGAIVEGLTSDRPHGFREIGPLSWAGEFAGGDRAGMRSSGPDPAKPAVFVLPGILGSNLKKNDDRIWLSFRIVFGLTRLEYKPGGSDGILPDGPVGMTYDDLTRYLSLTHEVIEFPYDWRRPIEEEAQRLADAVEKKLEERKATKTPVRLVAHSMGGLLARTMQLERPEVWKRMLQVDGARVLMLGTPNGGSWAPMQVLTGDDSFGNLLVGFGAPFREQKARNLMAAMPGFIQLQAKLRESGLDQEQKWKELAKIDEDAVIRHNLWHNDGIQIAQVRWGIPPQEVLDRAVKLRERLDGQVTAGELLTAPSKVLLVVGKSDFTPDGYVFGDKGLEYLDAQSAGDGRVTLQSARLPSVPAWTLDCEHGKLPDDKGAFEAYLELLEKGSTDKLPALEPESGARGPARAETPVVHLRSRRSRIPVLPRPPQTPEDALDATDRRARDAAPAPVGAALEVRVVNGNLAFVRSPLMIGHYRSEKLEGTERVMDGLIGGEMQEMLTTGAYPTEPGTNRVFPNDRRNPDDAQRLPRPAAVIVVGLGDEGDFRGSELVKTVRQGVIAAAQWAKRDPKNLPQFELAATLIGSGGPEISAGQAAQLVAKGVREANLALLELGGKWPLVGRLQLIELYLDRATEALRALQTQAAESSGQFRVTERIQQGQGALRRPVDAGYRGTSYDLIRALTEHKPGEEALIKYSLDTRRARTEVRSQQPQGRLVRELVKVSTRQAIEDRQIGPTLFRLLIPIDLEPYLGGSMEMLMELDAQTAGIPWELMDSPNGADSRPWAVRARMLRKLRVESFRARPDDAGTDAGVLIIGEPKCDDPRYPRLPGARREANAVLKRFSTSGAIAAGRLQSLIASEDPRTTGPSFDQVTKVMQAGRWRVVHVCGHGDEPVDSDKPGESRPSRGVVLSNNTFIGPAEIRVLQPVPELVFVNCCHLGASTAQSVLNRPQFAANVAHALIEIGVRCVVAAGWAVDDAVAEVFADTFYDRLLDGHRFMDAVALAREEAHSMGGNTWAAYQCYGDPNWTLRLGSERPKAVTPPDVEFAAVSSHTALILALETIATRCKSEMPKPNLAEQRTKIQYLQSVHAASWAGKGAVAEAFAAAWAEADDRKSAIEWYRKAPSQRTAAHP